LTQGFDSNSTRSDRATMILAFIVFSCLACFGFGFDGKNRHSECVPLHDHQEDEASVSLMQTSFQLEKRSKPWDEHLYVVGVYHKAGSQVLRNMMKKTFDALGADYSCRECEGGSSTITSNGNSHMEGGQSVLNICDREPDCPIHWNNCNFRAEALLADRQLAGEKGMRAVRIIRDPLQMVASAYCYHHAGNEQGSSSAPPNVMELNAEEGVPLTALTMLNVVQSMASAHQEATSRDTYSVVYENLTRSSADFDAIVAEMFDFLFAGMITAEERRQIEMEARTEDLNSEYFNGASKDEHVSDPDCKEQAIAALSLIPADLYSQYQEYQAVLGYI